MAVPEASSERVREYLDQIQARLAYLRGTGPNPFDYFLWADESTTILHGLFGDDAAEVTGFREAVASSGRTAETRGILGNMTLGLHGEWGIWARLERAEAVLRLIRTGLSQAAPR